MKIFLSLFGIAAAFIVGYSFEPQMRLQLTGLDPNSPITNPTSDPIPSEIADNTPADPATDPVAPPIIPEETIPDPLPTEPEMVKITPIPNPIEPEIVQITPAPEPEPKSAPEPAPTVDIVSTMQTSIREGEIREFTLDQVLDWQASPEPETIDGQTYLTGIASYKAETVFGVKTIQAKALIQDGIVVRWLWPKSGMEIK